MHRKSISQFSLCYVCAIVTEKLILAFKWGLDDKYNNFFGDVNNDRQ